MRRSSTFTCLFAFAATVALALVAAPVNAAGGTSRDDVEFLGVLAVRTNAVLQTSVCPLIAEDASDYTGILIDARQCPDITRSMSPAVYGPSPDFTLVYPDRSHVPTPDEVQDESIVRYYHTLDDAAKGVAGANPLVLPAVCVTGYAKDSVVVTAAEMKRMMDLDQELHFTRTWKVGFLIPPDK